MGSAAKMTCVSSAVKCFSMLLIALAVIFLINFAIISLYDGVWPRCYHINWGISYYYTINVWEGLWIPVPSFVTGIIGMTTACGPNKCKKWSLLVLAILTTLFNLCAFSPLVISFIHNDCDGLQVRESYFLIQIGLVFLFSTTSLPLSILTCLYKPTGKTTQAGTVLPSVHMVAGVGQHQQPVVYVVQQQHQHQQQQQQPPAQLQPEGEAQPQYQALPRA